MYGVGIEAGLVKVPYSNSGYMDFQFCAIISEDKFITLGSGIGFEYPKFVIDKVLEKNLEIGLIIGKFANNINLKQESGAIGFLSKGFLNREKILTEAVLCALLPRVNNKVYY